MPISLDNHTVSLTKNGYQKLWFLIRDYPRDKILSHLKDYFPTPAQYRPVAIKMLGGDHRTGKLPEVWDMVRAYGEEAIKGLLAVSIAGSHKELIILFANRTGAHGKGTIARTDLVKPGGNPKTYTNFVYAFDELGIAVDVIPMSNSFKYDWGPVLNSEPSVGPLVKKVIEAQLRNMGWKNPATFNAEAQSLGFPKIFGLAAYQFQNWLDSGEVSGLNYLLPIPPRPEQIKELVPELPLLEDKWSFSVFFANLDAALSAAGLRFDSSLQRRFVAGLLTKRFLILTGLSGSGKTKLALAFAKWICADASQIAIIPVGADWTSREPLLGYPNALQPGHYCRPDNGALDLVLEAGKKGNVHKPYFLILDEMNLSHVERYFADFLSAMESGEKIPLRADKPDWSDDTPVSTALPPNLFIIGTVNIDETTYMFSPKVLDRANTIEFKVSPEAMSAFLLQPAALQFDKLVSAGKGYAAGFVQVAMEKAAPPRDTVAIKQMLMEFFNELSPVGTEFGFRTAAEILRFAGIMERFSAEGLPGIDADIILDAAILQKLLPKIHGSRLKVEPTLKAIAGLCMKDKTKLADVVTASWEKKKGKDDLIRFPLTFDKIANMGRRLVLNGFTSYAEP
jgi:hypothetical protein